jgi:hypothetical protein
VALDLHCPAQLVRVLQAAKASGAVWCSELHSLQPQATAAPPAAAQEVQHSLMHMHRGTHRHSR